MGAIRFTTDDGKEGRIRSEELDELVAMPILDKLRAHDIDREGAISMAAMMLEWFLTGDAKSKRLAAEQYLFPEEFDNSP